jgi:hypothetical protein
MSMTRDGQLHVPEQITRRWHFHGAEMSLPVSGSERMNVTNLVWKGRFS